MGIASGNISYLRFFTAALPEGFEEPYCDLLASHKFNEIDPRSELEESVGWVEFGDAFDCNYSPDTLVSNSGHILLRLRIDKLKIPAVSLKAYVDQAARGRAAEAGRDKLTKREKDVLKLEVKNQLRMRSLPRMQLVEVVWNVSTGEVRVASTSKAIATTFVDKFEKTFSVQLNPVTLMTVLSLRGMSEADVTALSLVEEEHFHLVRHG